MLLRLQTAAGCFSPALVVSFTVVCMNEPAISHSFVAKVHATACAVTERNIPNNVCCNDYFILQQFNDISIRTYLDM